MPHNLKKLAITVALVLVAFPATLYWIYQGKYESYLVTPVDHDSSARVNFSIESGETARSIGARLKELDLIVSEWAFYKYVKETELGPHLEAGKFILKRSHTIPEIAAFLTKSRTDEVAFTIREGLTVDQVDRLLAEQGLLSAGTFEKCAQECEYSEFWFLDSKPDTASLEGYLFADTYFIDPETVTPQNLLHRMLQNFDIKLDSTIKSKIAMRSGASFHDIVTMASLIEKESRNPEEKPIVSGILWKRLKEKRGLGVDATIRYAVNKWTEELTIADLNVDSPYNTRKYAGLPPGPISNFSMQSFKAAIEPAESEYYYYLHDDSGKIHYAHTNDEHNANKKKYLN
ncbi:MAG: endolytic transglycosylase MltG [bacterium]|nr:endolytic transglycosylase MltG [bacterium]